MEELEEGKCSLLLLRSKEKRMDKVKRPKKVNRQEKVYLTNEKYQEYAETQFKAIYDKLDEIVENLNS